MSREDERQLQKQFQKNMEQVHLDKVTQEKILTGIHRKLEKENRGMKQSKKRMICVTAAAVMLVGTMTAVAAGKIMGLRSSTSREEAIASTTEVENKAAEILGVPITVLEQLGENERFTDGYITEVEALDEHGSVAGTYPEVMINYGENSRITLSISKPLAELEQQEPDRQPDAEEAYGDIMLQGREDQYLFLPPDARPAESDVKLQEEGKLWISYGSEKEERKVFRSVSWKMDGCTYLLSAFDQISLEELMKLGKEWIEKQS